MPAEFVPVKFAKTILLAVASQGYEVEGVIQAVALGCNPLHEANCPENIPADLYNRLYKHVMWLMHDEALGLQLDQRVPAGSFRMMCMCVIHCENLEKALIRAAEFKAFCRSLTNLPPLVFEPITVKDDVATCHIPDDRELFESSNIMGIAYSMSIWRRFASWLIGRNIEPLAVQFNRPQPANMEPLQQLFSCPIFFNQDSNGFQFAAHYRFAPLVHTEESLLQFLRGAAAFELIGRTNDESDDLLSRMRRLIGSDFSKDFPAVTTMAKAMNMSVRTLRRHLEKEGLTYQQFKDNTRASAAMQYLNRIELKINTVAALMGFDEPSAFHRSFKKWTSTTPGEYRSRCQT